MRSILVVCAGNLCRSPMAAGLLKEALPDCLTVSAGFIALDGEHADPIAIDVMQERGVDIREHRALRLAPWLVSQADLILVMTREQRNALYHQFPSALGKVFRVGEHGGYDVIDPVGQSRAVFEQVFDLLSAGVEAWTTRIEAVSQTT
jgi:protein-tyrosine phosphatase